MSKGKSGEAELFDEEFIAHKNHLRHMTPFIEYNISGMKEIIDNETQLVVSCKSIDKYIYNTTPLMNAVTSRNIPVINYLIDSGCDINKKSKLRHETALHLACQYPIGGIEKDRNNEIIKILLTAGADVTSEDFMKRTPYDFAKSWITNTDILNFLK